MKSEALQKGESLHEEFARVMELGRIALRAEMLDRYPQLATGRVVSGEHTGKTVFVPMAIMNKIMEAKNAQGK